MAPLLLLVLLPIVFGQISVPIANDTHADAIASANKFMSRDAADLEHVILFPLSFPL
jgi:hypothetical protein